MLRILANDMIGYDNFFSRGAGGFIAFDLFLKFWLGILGRSFKRLIFLFIRLAGAVANVSKRWSERNLFMLRHNTLRFYNLSQQPSEILNLCKLYLISRKRVTFDLCYLNIRTTD